VCNALEVALFFGDDVPAEISTRGPDYLAASAVIATQKGAPSGAFAETMSMLTTFFSGCGFVQVAR